MTAHDGEAPATFDADTAKLVLARALELQSERTEQVSIDELRRIATEVGIDHDLLSQAIQQVRPAVAQRAVSRMPSHASERIWMGVVALALGLINACVVNAFVAGISYSEVYIAASFALTIAIGVLASRTANSLRSAVIAISISWAVTLVGVDSALGIPRMSNNWAVCVLVFASACALSTFTSKVTKALQAQTPTRNLPSGC